jgi:formylglycine-generating enzyme required for sulfatase activity
MNSTSDEHSAHVTDSKAGVVGYHSKISGGLRDVIRVEPSKYELVWIRGGTFMMGSNELEDEKPVHVVMVPDFYIGRYPVTNEEYGRFIEATGYREPLFWDHLHYNQRRQPVVGVGWDDAKAFAKWAGLQLPTEARWEYACRSGTSTRYYTGDSENDLDRAGWYAKNSGNKLHRVGEKEQNAFGLYDMHGNVWEWCEDHWHDNYAGAPGDGSAWVDQKGGGGRVMRGGSWFGIARLCRSACRYGGVPDFREDDLGFRLMRLPSQSQIFIHRQYPLADKEYE